MSHRAGQRVVVRNRYATAEYKSLEEAADALSSIGVKTRGEVLSLLRDRTGYINGYVVTYPDSASEEE